MEGEEGGCVMAKKERERERAGLELGFIRVPQGGPPKPAKIKKKKSIEKQISHIFLPLPPSVKSPKFFQGGGLVHHPTTKKKKKTPWGENMKEKIKPRRVPSAQGWD